MADAPGSAGAGGAADAPPALEVRGASISFGPTRALRDVSLTIRAGGVHALVGQNGSGKSSLVKIITGVYRPARQTEVSVCGRRLSLPPTAAQLQAAHVGVVHQDMGIVPTMSIADNVMVTTDRAASFAWSSKRSSARDVADILAKLGMQVDPRAEASTLSEAGKAVVAFARALRRLEHFAEDGRPSHGLIVLDEVTARLGPRDSDAVHDAVRRLAGSGYGVLFVGHNLEEVVDLCDHATVLRDGQVAGDLVGPDLTPDNLLHLATGVRGIASATAVADSSGTGPAFRAQVSAGLPHQILLDASAGEVLGVTGLADSGVDMLPYAMVGRSGSGHGMLIIGADQIDLSWLTPVRALRAGIGIIPGDRLRNGIAGTLSTAENLAISRHGLARGLGALAPLRTSLLQRDAENLVRAYGVKPADPSRRMAGLSGGNQQKVLVARALALRPRLLIAHEPTAGVDALARVEIFRQMREAARDGCVVVICSQDVDEVWDSCDRVVVLGLGAVVASFAPDQASKDDCIHSVLSAGYQVGA